MSCFVGGVRRNEAHAVKPIWYNVINRKICPALRAAKPLPIRLNRYRLHYVYT